MQCSNHLRQIGLALHGHHDIHGVFPSNWGEDKEQTIPAKMGGQANIFTQRATDGRTYYWGVGDPSLSPRDQRGSWAFAVLPFLEAETIYDQRQWTVPLATYACPSRRSAVAVTLWVGLENRTDRAAGRHHSTDGLGLTPGGVGVQEGAGVIVAGGLGLDAAQMIVVFALIRAARIGMSILFGAPCWSLLPGHKATNGDGRHNFAAHNFVGRKLPKRVPG